MSSLSTLLHHPSIIPYNNDETFLMSFFTPLIISSVLHFPLSLQIVEHSGNNTTNIKRLAKAAPWAKVKRKELGNWTEKRGTNLSSNITYYSPFYKGNEGEKLRLSLFCKWDVYSCFSSCFSCKRKKKTIPLPQPNHHTPQHTHKRVKCM